MSEAVRLPAVAGLFSEGGAWAQGAAVDSDVGSARRERLPESALGARVDVGRVFGYAALVRQARPRAESEEEKES